MSTFENLSPISLKLEPDEQKNPRRNHEVALCADGSRIAVSTYFGQWDGDDNDPPGRVDVFQRNGENWDQLGEGIKGVNNGDFFGKRLAISADGSRVFISASRENNKNGGVYVYELDNNNWSCIHKLPGTAGERIGRDIAISDNGLRIAVGNYYNKVKIYQQGPSKTSEWSQIGMIEGDKPKDQFGYALDLSGDGNTLVVGAVGIYNKISEESPGKVKAFKYDGRNWLPIGEDLFGRAPGEFFGSALHCSGNGKYIAAGTPSGNKGPDLKWTGEVRWFMERNDKWEQIGMIIEGQETNVQYGKDLALSSDGGRLAVASLGNGNIEAKVHIYDLNLGRNNYKHIFDIPPPPSSNTHSFGDHISLTPDGRTIAVSYAAAEMVHVYKLPQPDQYVNVIEDQGVYLIQGGGKFSNVYVFANEDLQAKSPLLMKNLPDAPSDEELNNFLFRAHRIGSNTVNFESVKHAGYFISRAEERAPNSRHTSYIPELSNDPQQSRVTLLIQGAPIQQPNSFAFVLKDTPNYFFTNNSHHLEFMKTGEWFAYYEEAKEKASFYLRKKD